MLAYNVDIAEQFTSHLALHPEYVLLFREYLKLMTITSSPPPTNDMTHSQMLSPKSNDVGNGQSLVNNHKTQQQGAAGNDGEHIISDQQLLSNSNNSLNHVQITVEVESG